jgi:hypothetical protein
MRTMVFPVARGRGGAPILVRRWVMCLVISRPGCSNLIRAGAIINAGLSLPSLSPLSGLPSLTLPTLPGLPPVMLPNLGADISAISNAELTLLRLSLNLGIRLAA